MDTAGLGSARRGVAQLVEQRIPNPQVAGSKPVSPAIAFLARPINVFGIMRLCVHGTLNGYPMITVIKRQLKDLAAELERVDWPDKEKIQKATLSVVAVSLLIGVYLWGADVFFTWLTRLLLPRP